MSTTSTPVGLPAQRWSVKQFAILIALVLALAAGVFAVYAARGSTAGTTAPASVQVDNSRAAGGGCGADLAVGGGLIEGQSASNACGAAGGPVIARGVLRQ